MSAELCGRAKDAYPPRESLPDIFLNEHMKSYSYVVKIVYSFNRNLSTAFDKDYKKILLRGSAESNGHIPPDLHICIAAFRF